MPGGRLRPGRRAALLTLLAIGLIDLTYSLARAAKDAPVPTDPAAAPRTFGDLYQLTVAAEDDARAKADAAARADQDALDARAASDQVRAALKARLKKPFFVAEPDGAIVVVTPDASDVGYHTFRPDPADTPLDDAAPPAPAPAPEPGTGPAPTTDVTPDSGPAPPAA